MSRSNAKEDLLPEEKVTALCQAAREVASRAYAPYSQFAVGAAVLDAAGNIHSGCNVENASYGLTLCAERNAVTRAVATGARQLRAVAIWTDTEAPSTPCGACRQVLAEFGGPELDVFMEARQGQRKHGRLGDLLPDAFQF